MIGLLKNKSQYYTDFLFFFPREFLLFTKELIHFTQEILPLLRKKLQTPYSRNLRVPNDLPVLFISIKFSIQIFKGYDRQT